MPPTVLELRTVCTLCGMTFRGLGVHVWRAHGITARAYKRRLGLTEATPLTSEATHDLQRAKALLVHDYSYMAQMRELAVLAPPGERHVQHNMGAVQRGALADRNRALFERKCIRCPTLFVGRSGRQLCDACRDAAAIARAQPR